MTGEIAILLRRLEEGCGVPHSAERVETYAKAFGKLAPIAFERIVDHLLSEGYAAKQTRKRATFPTVAELWRVYRELRALAPRTLATREPSDPRDHLEYFANRLLWDHFAARGGVGPEELARCQSAKRELVKEFSDYVREGDELATPAEFIRSFAIVLKPLSAPTKATLERWERRRQLEGANVPMPESMARDLAAPPRLELELTA